MKSKALILVGDCRKRLRRLKDASVDAVVCDPPYGLGAQPDIEEVLKCWLAGKDYDAPGAGFMNQKWDAFVPGPNTWKEIYRVLKPGGHAVVFAGSRTVDLMGISLRLAGFDVRDVLEWVYSQSMPKALDVSKAIDRRQGAKRKRQKVKGAKGGSNSILPGGYNTPGWVPQDNTPITEDAKKWYGWKSALRPGHEPVLLVRKDLRATDEFCNLMQWIDTFVVRLVASAMGTGTSSSDSSRMFGVLSIVTSWNACLDASYRSENTSTTEMALRTIIVLRTLKSYLLKIMPDTIIQAVCPRHGFVSDAKSVGSSLIVEGKSRKVTQKPSVPAGATARNDEATCDMSVSDVVLCSTASICEVRGDESTVLMRAQGLRIRKSAEFLVSKSLVRSVVKALKSCLDMLLHENTAIGSAWQSATPRIDPKHEPILLCRKPTKGPIISNILKRGTGALNIEASRVGTAGGVGEVVARAEKLVSEKGWGHRKKSYDGQSTRGRYPTNVLFGHSDLCEEGKPCPDGCAVKELDHQSGHSQSRAPSGPPQARTKDGFGFSQGSTTGYDDEGGASRSFHCFRFESKPGTTEKEAGLAGRVKAKRAASCAGAQAALDKGVEPKDKYSADRIKESRNIHPTCKPVDLMLWLCRLVTPPGGKILDPFLGSGTTGVAALRGGFRFVGCELSSEYAAIAEARIQGDHALFQGVVTVDLGPKKKRSRTED